MMDPYPTTRVCRTSLSPRTGRICPPSCGLTCYLLLGLSFLSIFCLSFLSFLSFLPFLASFLALSFLPLSPTAFSSAFVGFLTLVIFSSMVGDVFVRASIYLSSRLTPTSLRTKSPVFCHLAPLLRIFPAHQRIFFGVQAKSLEIFIRHQVVGFADMNL